MLRCRLESRRYLYDLNAVEVLVRANALNYDSGVLLTVVSGHGIQGVAQTWIVVFPVRDHCSTIVAY